VTRRSVAAPTMPTTSEAARPTGAALGRAAAITSKATEIPATKTSQNGTLFTAETASPANFAPSTPLRRPD
jgi:hypothetical protein